MTIEISQNTPTTLSAEISDVELKALFFIKERWGFKDEASVFQFMLGVLWQAYNNTVEFTDEDGKKRKLSPAATLLKIGK